jgi:hypothetical protein
MTDGVSREAMGEREIRQALYRVYAGVRSRCYKPQNLHYYQYGDRGITICDEWLQSLDAFVAWAIASGWQPGLVLSRHDEDGQYNPSNCYFRTRNEVNRSRCLPDGRLIAEVAEEIAMNSQVLAKRIFSGWSLEDAFARPLGPQAKSSRPRLADGRFARDVAAENGIAQSTWWVRFNAKGWSLLDAVTVPPGGTRPKAVEPENVITM